MDMQRRNWLRGRFSQDSNPLLPPWSVSGDVFYDQCTRCNACITACPEKIIIKGGGDFPNMDFNRGECTFCKHCAQSCPENLFIQTTKPPWHYKAHVGNDCIAKKGVYCQSCQDHCETSAIKFRPAIAQISKPSINLENCTGCGACVKTCPVSAISVQELESQQARKTVDATS